MVCLVVDGDKEVKRADDNGVREAKERACRDGTKRGQKRRCFGKIVFRYYAWLFARCVPPLFALCVRSGRECVVNFSV